MQLMIDTACEKLFSCLHSAAQDSLPKRSKRSKVIPGWNDSVRILRSKATFWNRVWTECGCPSIGVLSQIRKRTKTRYKYAVRSAKRRKDHTVSRKISSALSNRNNRLSWKEIKRIKLASSGKQAPSPIIDGLIKVADITNNFSSKLGSILNSIDDNNINFPYSLDSHNISSLTIDEALVSESLAKLRPNKQDGTSFSSNHLLLAAPVLYEFLSKFFTIIIRHAYMPMILRNCTLVPIPKSGKDPSKSDNYLCFSLCFQLCFSLCFSLCIYFCFSLYFQSCFSLN